MDNHILALKPALADAGPPAELPPDEPIIEPLEVLEDPKVRTKLHIYAILVALYLVLFVAVLDETIIATAIPTISAALHSASGYIWIGGAYLLANAAAGPIWAKGSDIWGRKPALLGAVAVFAVASTIAAVSTSMRMLIAARALQGTAAGGLIQLVSITISDLFSLRSRALYLGLRGLMGALAACGGPLIGGAFTQLVDWRWCFWINLPLCGVTFVLLLLLLDVHDPRTKLAEGVIAVDWLGTLSILAVTLLLLLGLDFGGATYPWDSPRVICLMVFGTLMIGFFLFSEKRLAKYPLMPLSVFKNWSNNAAFLVAFAHNMVSMGAEYYLPLYFQSAKQASPVRSGILILPMMITEAAMDITAGIIGFEIIGGLGAALLFQAPMITIQNTVSQADTAAATATLGFIRNLAAALSIVLGGVVFQNGMAARHSSLAAAGLGESVLEALSGDQAAANVDIISSIQDPAQRRVVQDAFAWSLRNMFIMYTCVSAVAIVASAFIKQRHLSTEHTETKTGVRQLTKRVP